MFLSYFLINYQTRNSEHNPFLICSKIIFIQKRSIDSDISTRKVHKTFINSHLTKKTEIITLFHSHGISHHLPSFFFLISIFEILAFLVINNWKLPHTFTELLVELRHIGSREEDWNKFSDWSDWSPDMYLIFCRCSLHSVSFSLAQPSANASASTSKKEIF